MFMRRVLLILFPATYDSGLRACASPQAFAGSNKPKRRNPKANESSAPTLLARRWFECGADLNHEMWEETEYIEFGGGLVDFALGGLML